MPCLNFNRKIIAIEMKSIIITGGTRGIGYGLADAFLRRGCAVTICGRDAQSLEVAHQSLTRVYSTDKVASYTCDVRNYDQLQGLWAQARDSFGQVDIWINNAGIIHPFLPLWQQTPEQVKAVIDPNLLGTIYGTSVAIKGMLKQNFGAIYNMEGEGSNGTIRKNLTLYGTTKYGVRYLTNSFVEETKGTAIIVGSLSPGIVVTDLITEQLNRRQDAARERTQRLLNILADRVETVAPWLVNRILANTNSGVRIAWLTKSKALKRFLAAPFQKRDLFADEH